MKAEHYEQALERLPEIYARALRLAIDGHPPGAIAQRLDLEVWAVGPLLEVAELKLTEQIHAVAAEQAQGVDANDIAGPA